MEHNTNTVLTSYRDSVLDPFTDDVKQVILLINYVIICGVISVFGFGANIVIIIVFVKQGFKDSINISLLGLAFADLMCSITMLWTSISYNPCFETLGLPIVTLDMMYVTGGWPHECFGRITSFITAFITLERCLCIAMPLKVKTIITSYRTKVINVSIFASMILMFSPFYFVNTLEWRYILSQNRSVLGLTFTSERVLFESVTFIIHSVALNTIFLLSVAICTTILVAKLNKKSKWRETSTRTDKVTVKEKKVVKMITLISTIFIVCFVPPTVNFLIMTCYPQFNYNGKFHNSLSVAWSVAFALEQVNSSVNIFVYFNMSSKFKETFIEIFCFSKTINPLSAVSASKVRCNGSPTNSVP